MRVPISTPSAPSAKAAAIVLPSMIPPAATTGTSTASTTCGTNTIVETSFGFLNPPPSPPSTIRPSTPASTARNAPARLGTTWNTVSPASFSIAVYFIGSPAEVVTNFTPWSITKRMMSGSRTKACATFTPNGLSVSWRILRISSRTASSSPDEVSMIPMPPAFDTAEESCARAIQPIAAWMIGFSIPSISVMRVLNAIALSSFLEERVGTKRATAPARNGPAPNCGYAIRRRPPPFPAPARRASACAPPASRRAGCAARNAARCATSRRPPAPVPRPSAARR